MCSPRKQRLTDGTVSIEGVHFQIPMKFRHMERLTLAYARWDLSEASIVDPNTREIIVDIFPVDKTRNSSMKRPNLTQPDHEPQEEDNEQQQQQSCVSGYIPFEKEKSK